MRNFMYGQDIHSYWKEFRRINKKSNLIFLATLGVLLSLFEKRVHETGLGNVSSTFKLVEDKMRDGAYWIGEYEMWCLLDDKEKSEAQRQYIG